MGGCGCLLALIGFITPRIVMFFIWLMTDWFGRAYETVLWPLLGFLFMPYTTLAYMAAMLKNDHNVSGGWLVVVIVAVLMDLGNWGHGGSAARGRGDTRD